MESKGLKEKRILTILGAVKFSRSFYSCPSCGHTCYPGDEMLDIVNTSRSPGVRRMEARAGSNSTFKESVEDLQMYAGITVSAKDVERVSETVGQEIETWSQNERKVFRERERPALCKKTLPLMYISYDGTGIPMTAVECTGRKGKQEDGSAKTREAKLGCVFTQTSLDQDGFPIRDPDSTTFVGSIEDAETFGWRIYDEAIRRGMVCSEKIVVIADGAPWIWNLADLHFPDAVQIIDLYHVREHVSDLVKILFHPDNEMITKYRMKWWTLLDEGKAERIIQEASDKTTTLSEGCDVYENAKKEIAYLQNNKKRIRYDHFRREGLFVGSGVIEAGCKSVIGQRFKQSGMGWTVRGANAILALRCLQKSGRIEEFWEAKTG